MKKIDTTAVIGEDRQLILCLPEDVLPGEHRIIVMIDEPPVSPSKPTSNVPATQLKGNVLVYNGVISKPCDDFIEAIRAERLQELQPGRDE